MHAVMLVNVFALIWRGYDFETKKETSQYESYSNMQDTCGKYATIIVSTAQNSMRKPLCL